MKTENMIAVIVATGLMIAAGDGINQEHATHIPRQTPASTVSTQTVIRDVYPEEVREKWQLPDEQGAKQTAAGLLALKHDDDRIQKPKLMRGSADMRIPYINRAIDSRPIWSIAVRDLALQLDSVNHTNTKPYDWEVLLLADTGDMVQAQTNILADDVDEETLWPVPDAVTAEKQMKEAGGEEWLDCSNTSRTRSIPDVLAATHKGMGTVVNARQLIVHCVHWEMSGARMPGIEPGELAWSVDCRGIPTSGQTKGSIMGRPKTLEKNYTNHLRSIVNDRTNEWITATTIPQPSPPSKIKDSR